ncbi:DNA-binding protein [Cupriavidus sp. UYMU48A]|nr:DNA-binding protein [Cupriavidus sp. UYMU48A]
MPSYKKLIAPKKIMEAQLQDARASEVTGAIEQIKTWMAEYGLTVDDIMKRRRGRPAGRGETKPKIELPPKYRDPKTGKTWSGRGRAPAWLGKNRKRFLIAEE